MPIIDPNHLRAQASALVEVADQPAVLAARIQTLLEDYADRTHRLSPRLAGQISGHALKTPTPVLRAIIVALRPTAANAPSVMLESVKAIWANGAQEARQVAAELLGLVAPRAPENAHYLVEALLPDIESTATADALAEHGLGPLIRANPAAYVVHAKHWAKSPRKWTRRFALAVLRPLLNDRQWDGVPGALEVLQEVMTDSDAEVRAATVNTLRALIAKSPIEVGRFLRQQSALPHHNVHTVTRLALAKLTPPLRAEVERVLRGA